MALGHALLHPIRLREALNADASRADNMTAGADVALGLAGFGDPGPAAEAWATAWCDGSSRSAKGWGASLKPGRWPRCSKPLRTKRTCCSSGSAR